MIYLLYGSRQTGTFNSWMQWRTVLLEAISYLRIPNLHILLHVSALLIEMWCHQRFHSNLSPPDFLWLTSQGWLIIMTLLFEPHATVLLSNFRLVWQWCSPCGWCTCLAAHVNMPREEDCTRSFHRLNPLGSASRFFTPTVWTDARPDVTSRISAQLLRFYKMFWDKKIVIEWQEAFRFTVLL